MALSAFPASPCDAESLGVSETLPMDVLVGGGVAGQYILA